ncbi:MAG: hypothetical protein AAF495_02665 [Pseudomonadota bacterium]
MTALAILSLGLLVFLPPVATAADENDLSVEGKLNLVEQMLWDTTAVGVLTKLSLKAEFDALLDAFQRFHEGERHQGLDHLLHRYEHLMAKALNLVQGEDPALFALLYEVRPEMSAILIHPERYARVFGAPAAMGKSSRH